MAEGEQTISSWWSTRGVSVYLVAVGLLLLAASWGAVIKGSSAAAASLGVLAGGALIVAPFAPRVEGTLRIGVVELNLRRRTIDAIKRAPVETLEGILPLLESEDIGIQQVPLPRSFEGKSLTSPELGFLRKDLKLSVIAVRRPGEMRWIAGGQISDNPLAPGTVLLVAGPREALRSFQDRHTADQP